MANHRATPTCDFLQRAIDYHNIDSLKYVYSIASPKPPGRTFATHEDLVSLGKPRFGTDGWYRLSDGGSRDSHLERYLSVADDAELMVVGTDGPRHRTVAKGSIVLAEAFADGTWRASVPIAGDVLDDSENPTESIAGDGEPASSPTVARRQ